jgi:alkylated DNA repair dioxygenase AlkB
MSQLGFFESGVRTLVDDESGTIRYHSNVLSADDAAALFSQLRETMPWRSERRMMYDREVDVPRLVAWFPIDAALPSTIAPLVSLVEGIARAGFTSVGLNLYRDGNDSVAPHNDTLRDLVEGVPIALLSLGATRRMTIRGKAPLHRSLDLDLDSGSLLVMSYATQIHYDHAIPKTRKHVGPRISMAFRRRREVPAA